jgi:hypothetical protein
VDEDDVVSDAVDSESAADDDDTIDCEYDAIDGAGDDEDEMVGCDDEAVDNVCDNCEG